MIFCYALSMYGKIHKNSDTEKFAVIILKFEQSGSFRRSSLILVYTFAQTCLFENLGTLRYRILICDTLYIIR